MVSLYYVHSEIYTAFPVSAVCRDYLILCSIPSCAHVALCGSLDHVQYSVTEDAIFVFLGSTAYLQRFGTFVHYKQRGLCSCFGNCEKVEHGNKRYPVSHRCVCVILVTFFSDFCVFSSFRQFW